MYTLTTEHQNMLGKPDGTAGGSRQVYSEASIASVRDYYISQRDKDIGNLNVTINNCDLINIYNMDMEQQTGSK